MKLSEFKKLIREEIKSVLVERSQDEIDSDKKATEAEITAAKARIKMATANVKVAKDKLSALIKQKSNLNSEQPSSDTAPE
jgi:hypothetical protein